MFFNESDHANINTVGKAIKKVVAADSGERYLTVSGCIIARRDFLTIKAAFLELKYRHPIPIISATYSCWRVLPRKFWLPPPLSEWSYLKPEEQKKMLTC